MRASGLRRAELRALDDSLRKEIDKDRWVRVAVNPSDLRISSLSGDAAARLAVEPVRFAWGDFRFDGHVEALEETLDFFSPEGRPLRAHLSLSLRGETLRA